VSCPSLGKVPAFRGVISTPFLAPSYDSPKPRWSWSDWSALHDSRANAGHPNHLLGVAVDLPIICQVTGWAVQRGGEEWMLGKNHNTRRTPLFGPSPDSITSRGIFPFSQYHDPVARDQETSCCLPLYPLVENITLSSLHGLTSHRSLLRFVYHNC
jgi:hypothetical protein